MAGDHDNLVQKEMCDKEHQVVNDKLIDLKANILTSKESMSVKLDKVDSELHKALLGDISSPGGLISNVRDLEEDIKKAKGDWKEHKDTVDDKIKTQNFRMKLCLTLVGILIGGKVLGYSVTTMVDYMKPTVKEAPIVAPAPVTEEDDTVPSELKVLIQELLKNQEDHYKGHENIHLDIPKDKVGIVPSSMLDEDIHEDGRKDLSMVSVMEIISSTEKNK